MFTVTKKKEVYLYDGTFYGLLTILFHCYMEKCIPFSIYAKDRYIPNLIDQTVFIPTEEEKAKRIFDGIVHSISYDVLVHSYQAFLSEENGIEQSIVRYVLNGFLLGPKINTMLSIDFVWHVRSMSKKMYGEAHRLKGLLRFQEVGNNLYYASVHPDHNVIEHLGQHFMRRLPTQNFIIHDKNRNLFFLYDTHTYQIVSDEQFSIPEITTEERTYQVLWKKFFDTIAIRERKNPRLQMQYMPKKYWQDLVEKNTIDET